MTMFCSESMDLWKPVYGDAYYSFDTLLEETPFKDKIVRYLWLDLDDDEMLFRKHWVYKDYQSAFDAASGFDMQ